MFLGGRAVLSVPLIAVVGAVYLGFTEMIFQSDNALINGWSAFRVVAIYSAIIMVPVGGLLAPFMVVLGEHLPHPRWVWVLTTGIGVGVAVSLIFLAIGDWANGWMVLGLLVRMSVLGVICGGLWWLLVERHRYWPEDDLR